MAKMGLFGAAGAIGNSIGAALRKQNQPYRVVGRGRRQLEESFGNDTLAEIVTWNPDDPASVRDACRGIETLVYLVGVPYDHFELHPALMEKTLAGAIAEGVQRVALIGTVYPYGQPQSATVTENHPRDPGGDALLANESRLDGRQRITSAVGRSSENILFRWSPAHV